jgi:hypothetical protein
VPDPHARVTSSPASPATKGARSCSSTSSRGRRVRAALPVGGTVRRVDLPGVLAGTSQLVEIDPLPFRIAPALRQLSPGSPTFYLAYAGGPGAIADDDLLDAGSVLASVTGDAYIGVLLQDGMTLAPWAWIELLGAAMTGSGDPTGAAAWNDLAGLYAALPRTLRIVDHGRPVGPGVTFDASTNGQPPVAITTDASGGCCSAGTTLSGGAIHRPRIRAGSGALQANLSLPADATASAPPAARSRCPRMSRAGTRRCSTRAMVPPPPRPSATTRRRLER